MKLPDKRLNLARTLRQARLLLVHAATQMSRVALLCSLLCFSVPTFAAEAGQADMPPDAELPSAAVEVDGVELVRVRGTSAYSPERRAAAIAKHIEEAAKDASVSPDAVSAVETKEGSAIVAGHRQLMVLMDIDANLESIDRTTLAVSTARNFSKAITDYRQARSREQLLRNVGFAMVATLFLVALLALVFGLSRRLHSWLARRYAQRVHAFSIQSFQIVRAERIWTVVRSVVDTLRVLVILGFLFAYLEYVLALFPWTRGAAYRLLSFVLTPLSSMGLGFVAAIPDLIILTLIVFGFYYLLKILSLFFASIERGEITFDSFDREWAKPTYKLVRLAVIAFAVVVAYPYVPGSGSDAFKGISIFLGVLVSLGSSSAIANIIAGYQLTYRRAFKVGDVVRIGNKTGQVLETRLQATYLKTFWNEEVIIPNSIILNNEVVNLSSFARKEGVILRTAVGIGYETPWRQVEAMLIMAAQRTSGLKQEPVPFIRQRAQALGDYAISYEINVYCDDATKIELLYTALNRNILDVFNEYGIQIMTPSYRSDPPEPKLVPKEQWFTSPAKKESDGV
jgi:small-conductance mechanosensitive channel